MKELIKDVTKLVNEEMERSMINHPLFNSTHEGYAVIKEEVEEADQELNDVNNQLKRIWYFIKRDENVNRDMTQLKIYAIRLAAESIQVAAMAQKFIDSFKEAEINE